MSLVERVNECMICVCKCVWASVSECACVWLPTCVFVDGFVFLCVGMHVVGVICIHVSA